MGPAPLLQNRSLFCNECLEGVEPTLRARSEEPLKKPGLFSVLPQGLRCKLHTIKLVCLSYWVMKITGGGRVEKNNIPPNTHATQHTPQNVWIWGLLEEYLLPVAKIYKT